MAGGVKETLDELRAAWDAIPLDRRAAAGDQATIAAFMMGDALRILRFDVPMLVGPFVSAATKMVTAHMLWRVPVNELLGVGQAVFPELVEALRRIGRELGFDEDPPPPPPPLDPAAP